MRILSKFQDYYDGAGLAFGIEMSLTYVRRTEDVPLYTLSNRLKKVLEDYVDWLPNSDRCRQRYTLVNGVIGFCGRLYPVYKYCEYPYSFYTLFATYNSLIETENIHLDSEFLGEHSTKYHKSPTQYSRQGVKRCCFDLAENDFAGVKAEEVFFELNVPIFLMWNRKYPFNITLNPNLKQLEFQHYFEPLQAFQEISMFLGALKNKNENLDYKVGDDKIIAESQGHSMKTSFKNVKKQRKLK